MREQQRGPAKEGGRGREFREGHQGGGGTGGRRDLVKKGWWWGLTPSEGALH